MGLQCSRDAANASWRRKLTSQANSSPDATSDCGRRNSSCNQLWLVHEFDDYAVMYLVPSAAISGLQYC